MWNSLYFTSIFWSLGRYTDQGSKINISWENKTPPRNWLANINVWTLLSFQSSHSVKSLHIICSVVQGHSVQQMINWPLKKIPNEIRSYCLTFPLLLIISPGVQIMLLSISFFWVSNYYCNPYFICLPPPPIWRIFRNNLPSCWMQIHHLKKFNRKLNESSTRHHVCPERLKEAEFWLNLLWHFLYN